MLEWMDSHLLWLIIAGIAIAVVSGIIRVIGRAGVRSMQLSILKPKPGIQFGADRGIYHYSGQDKEGHVLVVGGSGMGKTTSLLVPTLRSWEGPSFCIDISGDISKNVSMPRTLIYEPENADTVKYDIFAPIDRLESIELKNQALEKLSFLLLPELSPGQASANAVFFNTEGRKILTAALIAFYHQGKDFIDICDRIIGNSYHNLFRAIDETENQLAIKYINSFQGGSEQTISGCKQSADAAIKLFATNGIIRKTIGRPETEGEITFAAGSVEDHNVFILVDDSRLELYAPLVHIIVAQVLEHFSQRSNDAQETIFLALDEFASFGKLEITPALRKLRKKKIRIMVLTQSLADLDLIYGRDERMAMMNNYAFKAVLGASDTESQEYFAKLVGHKEVKRESISRRRELLELFDVARPTDTVTQSIVRELAVQPEELAHLGKFMILLYPGGWCRLKKMPFYKRFPV